MPRSTTRSKRPAVRTTSSAQGAWQHDRKVADTGLVIKLAARSHRHQEQGPATGGLA